MKHQHKHFVANSTNKRVLIVDDDPWVVSLLREGLEKSGCRVEYAESLQGVRELISRYSFDAVVLDLVLGADRGLDAIPLLLREAPFTQIFVFSAHSDIKAAVEAMSCGATTFIEKTRPFPEVLEEILTRLSSMTTLPLNEEDLEDDLSIIGISEGIKQVRAAIRQLANVDSTVLITGESGTGKELVARGLHKLSSRRVHRFEAINCSAIPENLLESELFGHKRGSFTDAKFDRKGIFEICSEGTLFLDEIGELPITLQAKLLRVLQERVVTPIGFSTSIPIDTRVIAATNRNLVEEIHKNQFREDLYFRLSVVPLHVPPLRSRQEDIPILVEFFLRRFCERFQRDIAAPSNETMARLMAYRWPGNIRELQNAVERGVVLSNDGKLHLEHLFYEKAFPENHSNLPVNGSPDSLREWFLLPLTEAKQCFESAYLRNILQFTRGNVAEAARLSGRYRADIYRLVEKYDIHFRDE